MEPTGAPLPFTRGPGELIVQNGRQSGARRPLGMPLTIIGRSAGCDIRLNADGVAAQHCLLVHGPGGLTLRDLEGSGGTFVNGERISQVDLKEGDLLCVGPFQFKLHLSAQSSYEPEFPERDPVRLQVAAVAAQQVSLTEEETRLLQRRAALEQQEKQLGAHLEEKRRKLVQLGERTQAERLALQQDKEAYDQNVQRASGDLTQVQRELLDNQQRAQAERKRLVDLQRRLRQRMHRFWLAEREKIAAREETLDAAVSAQDAVVARLREREQALVEKRVRFNTLYELGRNHLRESWQRLLQDQYRWKHRRGKERAALKVRARDIENAERRLAEAQRLFIQEKRSWDATRAALQQELEGLENRVNNQRLKIIDQQNELARLDGEILARQQQLAELPPPPILETGAVSFGAANSDSEQVSNPTLAEATVSVPSLPKPVVSRGARKILETAPAKVDPKPALLPDIQPRLLELDRLTGEVADQRLQLVEQWERLTRWHLHWDNDRRQAALEIEELARRMVAQAQILTQREQAQQQADQALSRRHDEQVQVRQQLVAWRARLRVREKAWEGERRQLLTEVRHREELADKHLNNLVDVRQRWDRRRRQELDKLGAERQSLDNQRREYLAQRQELRDRTTALEEEKRILAEKAMALEHYRQEFLTKAENPAAERRIERLRRRWITQNANIIRATLRDREALEAELAALEARHAELLKRAEEVAKSEVELTEKQAAWEHKQALALARQTRIQNQLQNSEAQRSISEQQVAHMKEEIERIARSLIDEPDPPRSMGLERAA